MTHSQFMAQLEASLEEDLLSQADFDRLSSAVAEAWIADLQESLQEDRWRECGEE